MEWRMTARIWRICYSSSIRSWFTCTRLLQNHETREEWWVENSCWKRNCNNVFVAHRHATTPSVCDCQEICLVWLGDTTRALVLDSTEASQGEGFGNRNTKPLNDGCPLNRRKIQRRHCVAWCVTRFRIRRVKCCSSYRFCWRFQLTLIQPLIHWYIFLILKSLGSPFLGVLSVYLQLFFAQTDEVSQRQMSYFHGIDRRARSPTSRYMHIVRMSPVRSTLKMAHSELDWFCLAGQGVYCLCQQHVLAPPDTDIRISVFIFHQ